MKYGLIDFQKDAVTELLKRWNLCVVVTTQMVLYLPYR